MGAVLGTGPGRGIGLMYVLFALVIGAITITALRTRTLARFDNDDREPPEGWHAEGFTDTREECLAHIDEVWLDLRPRSVRLRLDGQ